MPALNFQKQFAPMVEAGTKCQTIRAHRKDGKLPATPGKPLSLWTGMRTKACRKLLDAECTDVRPIAIHGHSIEIGEFWIRDQAALDNFARDDGFKNFAEMSAWFEKTHGAGFQGHVIRWKPSDYSAKETANGD